MQFDNFEMPSINSYKLFLCVFFICSILNLTADINAEKFEHQNFDDVDTSMAKTVVSLYILLRFHLRSI